MAWLQRGENARRSELRHARHGLLPFEEDMVAVVVIGIDRHKGSHTAFALNPDETELGQLRVRACSAQVDNLRSWAASWPDRLRAIDGATGLGRLLARHLVAAGEHVLDVQPTLAARLRSRPCG